MKATIVIPVYCETPTAVELTEACLASVVAHSADCEIVVVNDNSPLMPELQAHAFVDLRPNRGFATACNAGASTARSDIIIFLNNDCEVTYNGWVDPLLDQFTYDSVGIVGCRLVYPSRELQHAGVYLDFVDGILTAHNHVTEQESGDVEAVTGACMAVRHSLFDAAGGFDAAFDNGYEDIDLCLRATEAGWTIRYTPDTTVIHHESQSGSQRWRSVGSNILLLHERYASTRGIGDDRVPVNPPG